VDGFEGAKEYTYPAHPEIEYVHPKEVTRTYKDGKGNEHVYMAQIPEKLETDAPVLIYLHGAGGKEDQGMGYEFCWGNFHCLRTLLAAKGWLYVSPRDYDQEGLMAHLKKEYGERQVFLAGPSAGGKALLQAAVATPGDYAGLIVMCPAWHFSVGGLGKNVKKLDMPIVLISGEKDGMIAPFCRELAARLKQHNDDVVFAEIPGAGHSKPIIQVNWEKSIAFVESRAAAEIGG
jgi:pimeloyl-ACP methyl ester carboxylesterase